MRVLRRYELTPWILALGCVAGCSTDATQPPAQPPRGRVVAVIELQFTDIQSAHPRATAIVSYGEEARARLSAAPSRDLLVPANTDGSGDATIQLESPVTSSFIQTTPAGAVRYLQATYRVRNAQRTDSAAFDTPRNNLTFVAVSTAQTIGETSVRVLRRADGADADPTLALQLIPTGAATLDSKSTIASSSPDVLQIMTEAEVAAVALPPSVVHIFPYGFMTRRVGSITTRMLSAAPSSGQFDGVITFAFRIPVLPNAADNPTTISVMMLALDDTDTRLSQSLEEQALQGRKASRARAASLNATLGTLLPGGTFPVFGGYRTVCVVRTAGSPTAPLAYLVNVTSRLSSLRPDPFATNGSGSRIPRTTSFRGIFTKPVSFADPLSFSIRGLQSGPAFPATAAFGAGADTVATPAATFFAGEEIEVVVTTALSCPHAAVSRLRVASNGGSGSYDTPKSFTVEDNPAALAAGDLDHDGIIDLAVVNERTNSVSVLLGNGDGTYQTPRLYAAGAQPDAVALGDLDADGHLDLAIASSGVVTLLVGNGDGTFQQRGSTPGNGNVNDIAIGDVNGDALLDIIVTNSPGGGIPQGRITVMLGDGDGTFPNRAQFNAGRNPVRLALADVNRDGVLDIGAVDVASDEGVLLLGNGDGTFRPARTFPAGDQPASVAIADVNRDGKPDFVAGSSGTNTVVVLPGNGDGSFQPQRTFATAGSTVRRIAIGDLNGDDNLDIVASNNVGVTLMLGNGAGDFVAYRTIPLADADAVLAVDANGNTVLDVIAVINRRNGAVAVMLAQ